MLEFRNINKSFYDNQVLFDVSFTAQSGEILALIGQNGAGKSTLVKILNGLYKADSGEILIDGESVSYSNIVEADEAGVGMVYQELSGIPHLTVAENVVLSQDVNRKFHALHKKAEQISVQKVFDQLGVDIDVTRPLGDYPTSTQQLVEIAKVVYKQPKLVVFDEPTTSLNAKEREKLFEVMNKMRNDGLTIIFITHYLEEIYQMADRCAVLRDGRLQYYGLTRDVDKDDLVSMMIGQRMESFYPHLVSHDTGKAALELKDFGGGIVGHTNLIVNYGEVVGLAGLVGAGRTELAQMIIGHTKHEYGDVYIDGSKAVINEPGDALKQGIAYVNEDRKNGGLCTDMGIDENILLPSIAKGNPRVVSKHGVIKQKEATALAEEMINRIEVKCFNRKQRADTLSGGNQQKVSVGKWIAANPKIYIFDEPTKGIDVLTKRNIYDIIRKLAEDGMAVLVISSYIPELLGSCDRIEVMSKGELVASFDQGATENDIMLVQ